MLPIIDIGFNGPLFHSAWAFETRLRLLLKYATLWKAVVLMDEADIFLEARDDHGDSNTRNALVAGWS
jgi:hypothetical protein